LAHEVSEEVTYLSKEVKEGVGHTLERAKDSLVEFSHWVLMSSRHYYESVKRKFDQFTHISNDEYETTKAKLSEIKRQTFEIIDLAKQKGIVLSEELINRTREIFNQQENELEELALKVKENVEKDKEASTTVSQPLQKEEKEINVEKEVKEEKRVPKEKKLEAKETQTSDVPITKKLDTGKIWEEIRKSKGEMFQGIPIKEKKEEHERIRTGTSGQEKKKNL